MIRKTNKTPVNERLTPTKPKHKNYDENIIKYKFEQHIIELN